MSKESKTYIASTRFAIGLGVNESLTVNKGTIVTYDGTVAHIEGTNHTLPSLGSAIKARWLVSEEDVGHAFTPKSANISMRHPTDEGKAGTVASTVTSESEQEVGTLTSRNESLASRSEGQEVSAGFSTPAINTAKGVDRLSQNSDDGYGDISNKVANLQKAEKAKMERELQSLRQQLQDAQQPQTEVREGIRFNTSGVSSKASDTTRVVAETAETVWDGEDSAVVGSVNKAEAVSSGNADQLKLARMMVPSFEWDFDAHWKTKIKVIEEKGDFLFAAAAFAVETPAMKKHISKSFPDLKLG